MGQQVESQVAGLELERVRDKVEALFDRDGVFIAEIDKKPVEVVSNRDMRGPLELRPGGRAGQFDPNGGGLGRGSGITYDKFLINTTHQKFAVEWSALSQWSTDNKRKAVLDSFRDGLAKGVKEFRRYLDSLSMTDGTGVLGTVSTYAVGTGLGGGDKLTLASDGFGARLVRFGQMLNVYNAALTTNRTAGSEREVVFHDLANKIIDISPSVAAGIATDKLVISGVTATPPVSLLGVPYHHSNASTGTWLGFDRALTPEIRANRVNAAGALALPFARLAINKIGDRVGIDHGFKCKAWMHPCQAQAYEELGMLVSQIHKQPKPEGLDLYFSDNMQMAGAPVKKSYSWDKTRIDFITDVWGKAEMKKVDFFEAEGRKIFEIRDAQGGVVAAFVYYLTTSFNLFVTNPAACSYIDGLTVPSGY